MHLIAPRGAREKLPKRRAREGYELTLRDSDSGALQSIVVEIGRQPDGRIAEVFVTVQKAGSYVRTVFEAWAMLASLAIQHGMPVSKLAQSMEGIQTGRYAIVDGPRGLEGCAVTSIFGAVSLVLQSG